MYKKKLIKKMILFYALAYTCLFTPMIVLCIVNRNEYFIMNKGGLSVAFGGILLILYVILLAKVGIKKIHQAIRASMLFAIVLCLRTVINDLAVITLCYWIGVVVFSILEIPAQRYREDLKIYRAEKIRFEARDDIATDKKKKKEEQPVLETVKASGRV